MKRSALVLVLLFPLLLAACGGGSSSTSANDEGAWVKEVETVMGEGGKTIEAAEEKINAAKTRPSLEAAYRTYAAQLATVATKLGQTEAPEACSSVKSHVVGFLKQFDSITGELGHQSALSESKFQNLVKQDTGAAQAFAGMMERIGSKGHC